MATRFADHIIGGDHASRPAANTVPTGTLYSCTDHDLVYQSDGTDWSTWAALGSGGGGGGGLVEIDEKVLGSDEASIDFTAIPATYTHLRLVARLRAARSANTAELRMRFGDGSLDTGTNYSYACRRLYGTAGNFASSSASHMLFSEFEVPGGNAGAGQMSAAELDIFYYLDAARRQVRSWVGGFATDPRFSVGVGNWHNAADPVERLSIFPQDGNWVAGSKATLYGIV